MGYYESGPFPRMPEPQSNPPDELRADVRAALKKGPLDSIKVAAAFAGAMVAACGVFGGGLVARGRFSDAWFTILGMIPVVSGLLACVVLELFRLSERSQLLQRLLDSEKYYDSLLLDAWTARDAAQAAARQLETRIEIVTTVREMLRSEAQPTAAPTQKSLPPIGEQDV